jgi:hypothetical protein
MIECNIEYAGENGSGLHQVIVDVEFPKPSGNIVSFGEFRSPFHTAIWSLAIKAALEKFIELRPHASILSVTTRQLPPLSEVVVPAIRSPRE